MSHDNFEFWIGLNDRSHEGDFNWLDKREKVRNCVFYHKH